MIKNPDGSVFKLKGSLNAYDPENPIHSVLNKYDEEIIERTGTPIYYYEVLIQQNTVDPIYNEDRGKLFNPCYVKLYAFYEPPQAQASSTLYGMDNIDEEVVFELNYQAVINCLKRIPKIGSRIYTPHRGENWQIIDYKLSNFALWGALRLILHCRKFQENLTNNNGEVTALNP